MNQRHLMIKTENERIDFDIPNEENFVPIFTRCPTAHLDMTTKKYIYLQPLINKKPTTNKIKV